MGGLVCRLVGGLRPRSRPQHGQHRDVRFYLCRETCRGANRLVRVGRAVPADENPLEARHGPPQAAPCGPIDQYPARDRTVSFSPTLSPVAATRVFLIRHGETALNAAGVLRGQLDVPLNETGQAEALALGGALNVPLASVTSSPLCRAVDTARPVSAASGASLVIDERLSDRFYGELAGHSLAQVEERFGSIDHAPLVEAWQLLEVRASRDAFSEAVGRAKRPKASHLSPTMPRIGAVRLLVTDLGPARIELPTGSWTEIVACPRSPVERGAPRQGPEQPPTGVGWARAAPT